jgi:hypothetical protein
VDGRVKSTRVCPSCAGNAIKILPIGVDRCNCGAPARVCGTCASERELRAKTADVTQLAAHLQRHASAYRFGENAPESKSAAQDYAEGFKAGLESAAAFLRSGRWS